MITQKVLEEAIFLVIKKSTCIIPPDVYSAFEKAIASEKSPAAKESLEFTFTSLKRSLKEGKLACGDTGYPLFFIKLGEKASIEVGVKGLEEVAKRMVRRATQEGYLRRNMKHPLTGADPGDNIGMNMPHFTYKFVPGDWVQITFVAKGGGGETFGGTRHQVIAFADGLTGIKKFIIDCYVQATRAGAICPPGILGVGIGGSGDISMKLAKEAATLRLVGSRHPEPMMANLEEELYSAINNLKIGAMGLGGDISVLAVNVEYAYCHEAGVMVAMNTNCQVARRATVKIYVDGRTEEVDDPDWFERR